MALNEGGAAGLLGGEGGAGESGAGGGGDAAAAAAAAAAGGGDSGAGGDGGAAEAAWLEQFSAEGGEADNPSNRDWLKAKGFKSLDDVAKSYREAEKGLRDGGRIKVPGDGAKPEEIAAFHKAIGVPEKPDDYAFDKPADVADEDLNIGLIERMRTAAHKAGAPAGVFKTMAEEMVQAQLDEFNQYRTAEDGKAQAVLKEWGAEKDARLAEVSAGMKGLGLSRDDVAAIQRGYGSDRTLKLLQKIGAGMAEDALVGGGKGKFGITGEEAQAELDRLNADPEHARLLAANDPAATARRQRLIAAVADAVDRKNREAGGG
jgi:hypothetical protein